jgi:hypothetical protein
VEVCDLQLVLDGPGPNDLRLRRLQRAADAIAYLRAQQVVTVDILGRGGDHVILARLLRPLTFV